MVDCVNFKSDGKSVLVFFVNGKKVDLCNWKNMIFQKRFHTGLFF